MKRKKFLLDEKDVPRQWYTLHIVGSVRCV